MNDFLFLLPVGYLLPMARTSRADLELDIRRLCDARDFDGATTAALRGYGPEILQFLLASHRNETDASEVFSLFAEGLWRSIEGFAWSSSFRTWAYVIARRASLRHRRKEQRKATYETSLPEGSEVPKIEQQVRTETLSFLRTERRTRLLELRESLPPEEQTLLLLRVDRELSWNDLARVLHEGETELEGDALARQATRLRKRFQLVKEKIHEMAEREGLVEPKAGERGSRQS